jgi:hypothetical protein
MKPARRVTKEAPAEEEQEEGVGDQDDDLIDEEDDSEDEEDENDEDKDDEEELDAEDEVSEEEAPKRPTRVGQTPKRQPVDAACSSLPTAKVVRRYLAANPEMPLSLSYDSKRGRVVVLRDGTEFRIGQRPPFAGVTTKAAANPLADYGDAEEVHLDAVSLLRVLLWEQRRGCALEMARAAASERVDDGIRTYHELYARARLASQKLRFARAYLLDAIGAYLVLLELDYIRAVDLRDERPLELFARADASAAELARVGTELHRVARFYIDSYGMSEAQVDALEKGLSGLIIADEEED